MKIVVGSDFHIGNKRLSHDNFLLNVETYLYPELRDCDVFIIAGDFFDRMLKLDEKATHVAVKVINDILEIGQINKMAIRVLRGTFTHDKNQNELFWTLAEGMDIDLDYISSLSISTIKKEMRLKVLYIPDNLVYQSSSDCIAAIKELLRNAKTIQRFKRSRRFAAFIGRFFRNARIRLFLRGTGVVVRHPSQNQYRPSVQRR